MCVIHKEITHGDKGINNTDTGADSGVAFQYR